MLFVQDAKLRRVDGSYLLSPAIRGIFPFVQVHDGFTGELLIVFTLLDLFFNIAAVETPHVWSLHV